MTKTDSRYQHVLRGALVLLLLLAMVGCRASLQESTSQPIAVSMVELLTDGERFVGEEIITTGFLNRGLDLRLFLTEEHAKSNDGRSSVLIYVGEFGDLDEFDCFGAHFRVTGRLVSESQITMALTDIQRIVDANSGATCWERTH